MVVLCDFWEAIVIGEVNLRSDDVAVRCPSCEVRDVGALCEVVVLADHARRPKVFGLAVEAAVARIADAGAAVELRTELVQPFHTGSLTSRVAVRLLGAALPASGVAFVCGDAHLAAVALVAGGAAAGTGAAHLSSSAVAVAESSGAGRLALAAHFDRHWCLLGCPVAAGHGEGSLVRPAVDDWAVRGIFRLRDVRVAHTRHSA
mmetsp:Transcript_87090/g.120830  ORF Transcript_87090/g.120830 Transcript_87090/m.120830 type:complete len:204 (+) Transcript_87090:792-1403(+)